MGKGPVQGMRPLRGERAHIVREGLKAAMTGDQIVAMVQERFPAEPRKRVQTMISRYRLLKVKRDV